MLAAILTQMQSIQLNSEVITFHLASTMCLALCYRIGLQQPIPSKGSKSEEEASTQHVTINLNPCPTNTMKYEHLIQIKPMTTPHH